MGRGTVHCEAGLAGGLNGAGEAFAERESPVGCVGGNELGADQAAAQSAHTRRDLKARVVEVVASGRMFQALLPNTSQKGNHEHTARGPDHPTRYRLGHYPLSWLEEKKKAPTEVNSTTVALLERGETQKERQPASFVEPSASSALQH